ncbi:uncharacterized protein [Maniola hyperantus]|uniref:uncharacterized protein n=1 Tax=Aphantopus hyperantus TaxID=2795564 RepID=UPI001569C9DB|nr:uncharacterized protein LOC117996679 [Maniola hyperantus]
MSLSKKLILQVKSHPEIWQLSSRLYKNKIARARGWKAIATELGKDEEFLKKRWKNLKDAFRKELKRIIVKEIDQSQWQYFDVLAFITEEVLKGIVKGKSEMPDIEVTMEPINDDSDDPLTVKLEHTTEDVSNTSFAPSSSTTTVYDTSQNTDSNNKSVINSKIKNITKQLQTGNTDEELTGDADYLFLVSLLPTIRKLSYVQKLQFRGKINQWLLEAVAPDYCNDFDSKMNDDFS